MAPQAPICNRRVNDDQVAGLCTARADRAMIAVAVVTGGAAKPALMTDVGTITEIRRYPVKSIGRQRRGTPVGLTHGGRPAA
jgi:hypothetical protein